MKHVCVTSPDLGMIDIPIGTRLTYAGYEYDNAPKRQGWVWYNFYTDEEDD